MNNLTRSVGLIGYGPLASSLGADVPALLAQAGIAPESLEDPDIQAPFDGMCWLLEETARLTGADDFGLRLAATRDMPHYGAVALVLREAATLRAMLQAMDRYHRVHNEAVALWLEDAGAVTILHTGLVGGTPGAARQATELVVGVLALMLKKLIGPQWAPQQVCFMHDKPARLASHRRLFGRKVAFRCPFDGLVIDSAQLDLPAGDAQPGVALAVRRQLEAKLAAADASFEQKVVRLAHMLLPMGYCTVERIAQHLNIDRRTVHRQLAKSGATFTHIVDDVQAELAIKLLETSQRPLTEIAELLGFAALSGFSRWFRARFGVTPTAWRAAISCSPPDMVA